MTCKDCLHREACNGWKISEVLRERLLAMNRCDCKCFTNRSEWVHLPCKVGDNVWYIHRQPDTLLWDICETEVYEITLRDEGIRIYVTPVFCGFLENEIGKKLFLTRKEAEKALERMKENE